MQSNAEKLKILYLCTGNSCRSQMAEGWTRHLKNDQIKAYSAGVEPHGIDPRAVKVMAEVGIDISGQASKHLDTLQGIKFDYVSTLCDQANSPAPCFSEKPGGSTWVLTTHPSWQQTQPPKRKPWRTTGACAMRSEGSWKSFRMCWWKSGEEWGVRVGSEE